MKRISSMEDEYAQFKKSLLRDANYRDGEEAMGSDSPVMGPEIESVEQRLAKTHPKPQRQRSSDNLKSIFGGTSSTSTCSKGDDLVGPDLVAFSRRIGEDEPFPGAILSPEMEAAAEGSLKPPELGGIAVMPTNFLVGFNGNEVVFSEVNQFHAWPIEYRYSLPYEVKAIAVYDNSVVAMTTAQPYLLTGYEPSVMSITEVTSGEPAFSQKGAADMGAMGIGFVSNDGFIVVSGTSAVNITEDQYSPEEWKAMEPGWMTAEYSNGRLYIFSELATLVADLNKGRNTWTRDSLICRSGFDDLARNRLLVVEPSNIQEWRGGENYRDGFWSSKQWLMPRAVSLGAFRV